MVGDLVCIGHVSLCKVRDGRGVSGSSKLKEIVGIGVLSGIAQRSEGVGGGSVGKYSPNEERVAVG